MDNFCDFIQKCYEHPSSPPPWPIYANRAFFVSPLDPGFTAAIASISNFSRELANLATPIKVVAGL
jgi:hypothetical protein